MPAPALDRVLTRDRIVVAASLLSLCLLAWLFLLHLARRMATMDGLAGRVMGMRVEDDLSGALAAALSPGAAALADGAVNFVLVALMWAVMMVGMMTPGAAPTILLFAALERRRAPGKSAGRTPCFIAGYLAVWLLFSVFAAAMQTALTHAGFVSMQMAATNSVLAGSLLVAAGLYEFTPLKARCLIHCRSPLDWIPRHLRPGRAGAFRMGVEHGAFCVGCCWALMLLLFVAGVMNLVWVAAIAGFVLIQKIAPGGPIFARLAGAALTAAGTLLIARPFLQ